MTLLNNIKSSIEALSGHRVWLGTTTEPHKVAALVHSLKPVPTKKPLIRVGGTLDGGYLVPDDLEGIKALISPGVSIEISFDLAMAERGMEVFMADASVNGPPVPHEKFHFQKKFLDVFEDEGHMRLDTLSAAAAHAAPGDQILQMDIEGAEYKVLLDASEETLKRFRIIAIEFHQVSHAFASSNFPIIEATFRKLLRFHDVVHIHPNNASHSLSRHGLEIPALLEFTFYRRDRLERDPNRKLTFPHALDQENEVNRSPMPLPRCWWP